MQDATVPARTKALKRGDDLKDRLQVMRCPESGYRYKEVKPGVLRCLDLDEEAPLPAELKVGKKSYRPLKEETKYECSLTRS
jgi:UDP-2-acetamido-3-amino-2,3-dideoxy-glucuronate N-acetyltransferase